MPIFGSETSLLDRGHRWHGKRGASSNGSLPLEVMTRSRFSTGFEQNTKSGSHYVGPLFIASFYFDACFWNLFIPIGYGRFRLDPFELLKTMPDVIKESIKKDSQAKAFFGMSGEAPFRAWLGKGSKRHEIRQQLQDVTMGFASVNTQMGSLFKSR
jgi:hypothetical protein